MNTKFNKLVKTAAVGIFFMALLLNVKLSLTDPFINMDNAALAQSSSSIYEACPGTEIALHYQNFIGYSVGMDNMGIPIYRRIYRCEEGGWCCPMEYA
ncbi:hypothetical protein U3A58_19025 [Algoriphagus sp. C2-6-M1]|uniref:hypothetical protein n=1 Tax=Algoriphagus persicinus TaxID=3108754 RepID=UPI002B3B0952|nr:hypothetical protein [Algoriphagus sp. C2-6-M1]MEB2782490.1 hypothetical protein [Algoriphagus sp. C2-6-M1]